MRARAGRVEGITTRPGGVCPYGHPRAREPDLGEGQGALEHHPLSSGVVGFPTRASGPAGRWSHPLPIHASDRLVLAWANRESAPWHGHGLARGGSRLAQAGCRTRKGSWKCLSLGQDPWQGPRDDEATRRARQPTGGSEPSTVQNGDRVGHRVAADSHRVACTAGSDRLSPSRLGTSLKSLGSDASPQDPQITSKLAGPPVPPNL